jgi:1-deoxy-D-xylulose-5-phosphate synthase
MNGNKNAIFSFGTTLKQSLLAAQHLNATLIDMRFIKPLDEALIIELSKTHERFISIEDNTIKGGAGSAISELLHAKNIQTPLSILGLPDQFSEQASQDELYDIYGLNSENIIKVAEK